jgi:putative ABC transport system permease protein
MSLVDVIVNNLRRRLGRKLLLMLGMTLGAATVVALTVIMQTMNADVATKLDEYGANIIIVPQSNGLSLSYGGVAVASAPYDVAQLSLADLDGIQTIKNARNISVVAPKLLGSFTISGQSILAAGVRFADEIRLKQWWRLEGREPTGPDEVLAGRRLADALRLEPGSELQVRGRTFHVAGVLEENGSQDDDILFIDLTTAQQILDKPGSVSMVEVAALCTACPVEDMVEQIAAVLPDARVTALRQAVTLRMETVGQLMRFALVVSVVVVAIGALVVLTTMLGAVGERRQEIGLFRALGFRQRHVIQIILGEAAAMTLAGGIAGWLLGMAVAVLLTPRLGGVTTSVVWDPRLALAAIIGSVLVGLLASLYPALYASQLDPSTALRSL